MNRVLPVNPVATEFEKRRGVSSVEIRDGFAMVHVAGLNGDLSSARLATLEAVANAGVSIDFLKFTPGGLSFLISEADASATDRALTVGSIPHEVRRPRSIVLVYAVNIRDEEGMIAGIVKTLIEAAAPIDHLGDMHDRMLVVIPTEDARRVADRFRQSLTEGV